MNAQKSRMKAGISLNYISNTFPDPHLYDYLGASGNFAYTITSLRKFDISIENTTSVRSKTPDNNEAYHMQTGFTTSLPVVASLQLLVVRLYAGTGPAYVRQTAETYAYYEKASGLFLNTLAGIRCTGKAIIPGVLYLEYNTRLSYMKSLDKSAYDGAMISFIFFLKGKV